MSMCNVLLERFAPSVTMRLKVILHARPQQAVPMTRQLFMFVWDALLERQAPAFMLSLKATLMRGSYVRSQ